MTIVSELKAQEAPVAKAIKAAKPRPVTFVGHFAADQIEASVEKLAGMLPEGWTNDVENVAKSMNPLSGRYGRYLHLSAGPCNLTVFSNGTVNIVHPDLFIAVFGKIEKLGIREGKAPAAKAPVAA